MRTALLPATLLLIFPQIACTRPHTGPTSFHETRTFPATPGKLVVLDLRSLDGEVVVGDGDTIAVNVEVEARSSPRSAAARWVERHTPVIEDGPARLEVREPRHSVSIAVFGFIHTAGRVHVAIPAGCRLEVRTASGDVRIDGERTLAARLRVDTSSGDVTVRGGAGELIVETASGNVRVSGPPLAALDADTRSGDVRLDSGAARATIETGSGDVRLKRLGGDLTVATSSGDVEAGWSALPQGARVKVSTSSGSVALRLPATAALHGDVHTRSGRIRSDFPCEFDRREHACTLSAPAATAEAPTSQPPATDLTIRTSSGDVTLIKQAG